MSDLSEAVCANQKAAATIICNSAAAITAFWIPSAGNNNSPPSVAPAMVPVIGKENLELSASLIGALATTEGVGAFLGAVLIALLQPNGRFVLRSLLDDRVLTRTRLEADDELAGIQRDTDMPGQHDRQVNDGPVLAVG